MQATYAEINLAALRANVERIRQKVAPAKVMAVVKANAYGHGAVAIANAALQAGAGYLGVALVEEGIELRKSGITAPILVFGGLLPGQIDLFLEYNLEMTVYSPAVARKVAQKCQECGKEARVHVKIDTGMGRVGCPFRNAVELIREIVQLPRIQPVGVSTHFATSDERDKTYALLQLERYQYVLSKLEKRQIQIPLKHAANSGAILDLPSTYFDMVRAGIMMYGWYPSPETSGSVAVQPVMSFKTRVLFIKNIPAGESVSYGRKFISSEPTRIATLPVGYADGYNRLLTNRGSVLIRGQEFPVVGRVCMDLIHVNLGGNIEIQEGDEVVLFGRQENAEVSVYDICKKLNTIPYEVCCWVSQRVPRIYID